MNTQWNLTVLLNLKWREASDKMTKAIVMKGADIQASQYAEKLQQLQAPITDTTMLVVLPGNTTIEHPLEINEEIAQDNTTTLLILAEKGSQAKVVLTKTSPEESEAVVTENVHVLAEPTSKLDLVTLLNTNQQTTHNLTKTAICKRDATVNWIELTTGGKKTTTQITTNLNEEGATTNKTILFLGKDKQNHEINTLSVHNAPRTYSDMVTKGVLNHEAKARSKGLIKIGKNAPESRGYEKQDTLLLSKQAQANAVPDLEIHNHDVKCSHGSTVGQVDETKLFYLMSRGLDETSAKQKIVEGYFTPILKHFKDPALRETIHQNILTALE